jgi:FAD-dependent urate hydroxylase
VGALEVVIVGGGIGGLGAALCLARLGHRPTVLEQVAQLRPVGAGISLWPNGIKVLDRLGLGSALASLGGRMERMAYADQEGRPLIDFSLQPLYDRVGERARPVARADLQALLLAATRAALGPDQVRLGTPVIGVREQGDRVVALLADGGEIDADVLVAADGTHSRLRDHVLGEHVERRYVGYVNWNGLVAESTDIAPAGTWLTWVGGGRRASVMPVGGGRCYWFCDTPLPLDAPELDLRDPARHLPALQSHFAGWAPAVATLLERADPAGVARLPIHDLDPLPRWHRRRVALLGDAAHSMAPDLGQGGCQALEDAWVLARELSGAPSVDTALERYAAERMPHTADIVRRARQRADLLHAADPAATEAWYRSLPEEGAAPILDGLARSVETGALG